MLEMNKRNHLIALILIAGIASSSMLNGKRMAMCSFKGDFGVSKKVDLKWESVRSSHKVFSIGQFIADFFFKLNQKSPLELDFQSLFLPFIFSSPVLSMDIDPSIFINAP